jgi:hypothetical protein
MTMEAFDDQESPRPGRPAGELVWNLLTLLVLLLTAGVVGVFAVIFTNPTSALNPFPPPTMPALMQFPTETPTPQNVLPPTWTPAPTNTLAPSPTPLPSNTPEPTVTPFILSPSATPTTTQETSGMRFIIERNNPIAASSKVFHPEAECKWMGVAGQVFDITGAPITTGVQIWLGGVLNGVYREIPSLTGVAQNYGPAGYEIYLGDTPTASRQALWVQLLDQAGLPMSERVYFDTYADCEYNVIIINFRQVR